MLRHEKTAWLDGFTAVAGLDEAGRGPLAGPVVAAAVLINREFLQSERRTFFRGLNDSKQMLPELREIFFEKMTGHQNVRYGVGLASVEEIDRFNILQATHMAMRRALASLVPFLDLVLVDGLPVPSLPCPSRAIVQGDAQSLSIAAASVIAKVTRDRLMKELHEQYPQYGFAQHKGYGTREHCAALECHGPSPVHRRSFSPVKQFEMEL
jgi:ribonuclease HII